MKQPSKFVYTRPITPIQLEIFRENIACMGWGEVYRKTNANEAYDLFLDIFRATYNDSFPLRKWVTPNKARKPWITKELIRKM